ncbi:MAG: L-2-amino-thiazoline-4-carboxylic acid hydrolase [Clostridia bacterium]|nr:L-2-amino-thiazoline-4-carboxylic acid hydrolase [Clostridia bacterium]
MQLKFEREGLMSVKKISHSINNQNENSGMITFSPAHHAVLFAIFVRNIKKENIKEADEVIEAIVTGYAIQRGSRMAQRAIRDHQPLTLKTYMAYGEWEADEGTMQHVIVDMKHPAITRVLKCPWYTAWQKYGFLKEAVYYCQTIDLSLVKGFNEKLSLTVNSIKPKGNEYCEFKWDNADLAIKKKASNCVKDWEYHLLHLFSCFKNALKDRNDIIEKTINDFNTLFDIDLNDYISKTEKIDFNKI